VKECALCVLCVLVKCVVVWLCERCNSKALEDVDLAKSELLAEAAAGHPPPEVVQAARTLVKCFLRVGNASETVKGLFSKRKLKSMKRSLRHKKSVIPSDERVLQCVVAVAKYLGVLAPEDDVSLDDLSPPAPNEDRVLVMVSEVAARAHDGLRVLTPDTIATVLRTPHSCVKSLVKGPKSVEDFVQFWRRRFLDAMNPKFLPPSWSVHWGLPSVA
jgi:hypothetical protein